MADGAQRPGYHLLVAEPQASTPWQASQGLARANSGIAATSMQIGLTACRGSCIAAGIVTTFEVDFR